jgi:hypothetical protein
MCGSETSVVALCRGDDKAVIFRYLVHLDPAPPSVLTPPKMGQFAKIVGTPKSLFSFTVGIIGG